MTRARRTATSRVHALDLNTGRTACGKQAGGHWTATKDEITCRKCKDATEPKRSGPAPA